MALKGMTPEPESTQPPKSQIEYSRAENFISRYSNNAQLQGNAWDLRLTFGELDLNVGPNAVAQHTSITLPWNQVKVLIYFLRMQLATYEIERNKVRIPKEVIFHLAKEPPKDVNVEAWHAAYELYQELLAENPDLVPA